MAYKIEVTADSLSELAGKILAVAAQFQAAVPPPATLAQIADDEKPKSRKAKPVEEAETAPADPTPAPKSAPVAEATESLRTTEQPASTPASVPEVDFEKEITPLVLNLAQTGKREALTALLDQFGATRASQVPKELWGELLDGLRAL